MRIAVVGCGYVGTALGKRLCQDGVASELVATTTSNKRLVGLESLGFEARRVELPDDVGGLAEVLRGCKMAYFTAAPARARGVDDYRRLYVDGARALLTACGSLGVPRLIYTSSSAVYGQQDGSWVDESSSTDPGSERGRALLEAERLLLDAATTDLQVSVLRLSGIYGPDRGPQRVLDRVSGQERSDGAAFLNLIHCDDVVEALVRLAGIPHDGLLNWSDDQPVTRRDFYDPLLAEAGLDAARWVEGDTPELGKRISNALAKRVLGLELLHPRYGVGQH